MFLFSSIIYGQSLKDLLSFKTMSLNQIEEKLILENWNFKSSKNELKRNTPNNSKNLLEMYNASISRTYESRTYEYNGYLGDVTTFTITDYEDDDKNDLKIISENRLVYKNILEDLVKADFSVTNENSPYVSYYLGDFNIGEEVTIESSGKVYRLGNQEVHLIIYRRAIVTNKNNGKFSYDPSEISDEYQIIVK